MNRWLVILITGLIVLTGCGSSSSEVGTAPAASQAQEQPSAPMADPVAVEIEAIDAVSSLLPIGLDNSGAINPDFPPMQAVWYQHSVRPGEVGPMILAGHVDGDGQAGIFNQLANLPWGSTVSVASEGGMVYDYEITNIEQYPKSAFPTDLVYGDTQVPTIRLITCGGPFGTERAGHYDDNVVAYGTFVGSRYPD